MISFGGVRFLLIGIWIMIHIATLRQADCTTINHPQTNGPSQIRNHRIGVSRVTTQPMIDWSNTWTSVPMMLNQTIAYDCFPNSMVNDMNDQGIWYFACSYANKFGPIIKYSMLTNTSESLLAPEVAKNMALVSSLHQDSNGHLFFVSELKSDEHVCGYIKSPLSNSTVLWLRQPPWLPGPWFPMKIAAHEDLVYFTLDVQSADGPSLVRFNLTDVDHSAAMVFSASYCSTTEPLVRYDWYLDAFLCICDQLGVMSVPYQTSIPPYVLVPQLVELSIFNFLRVNSTALFLAFGNKNPNDHQCVMIWTNTSSYELVMNCEPHLCPSIESWTYSPLTETILVTCQTLFSGSGAIVAIQPTQGVLSLENVANIRYTFLASICSDTSGPHLSIVDPFSRGGFAVLCDDGGRLFRGQSTSLLISPPTCDVVSAVQTDPLTDLVLVSCDGNLLAINGASLQHTFTVCYGQVSEVMVHSSASGATYTMCQKASTVWSLCAIQPITHQMMVNNVGPTSQLILAIESPRIPPTLLITDQQEWLVIFGGNQLIFLNESNYAITNITIPSQCINSTSTAVSMNGFLWWLCYSSVLDVSLVRLDLNDLSGGWMKFMQLTDTCAVFGTLSARPLANRLYYPCDNDGTYYLRVINCTTHTSELISLLPYGSVALYFTMVDVTSSFIFFYTQGQYAPYLLIAYDEMTNLVWPNLLVNQPCDAVSFMNINPASGTIYVTCQNSNVVALSKGFKCQEGYEWNQNQQCTRCTIGSARGVISPNETYVPQCALCLPGTIAVQPGSAICEPCAIGRFQDLSLQQQVCSYCQPGKYQNETSQSHCLVCPPGQYTGDVGYTHCNDCAPGRYAKSNTSTTCDLCDRGTASNLTGLNQPCPLCPAGTEQLQYGGTSCSTCSLGSYSESGNECVGCALNSYQPQVGQPCVRCDGPNQVGLLCSNGLATVEPGYFAYPIYDSTVDQWIYATTDCPPNYCPGSPLQVLNSTNMNGTDSSIQYCLYPRLNSADNLICASCEDGFIVWGQSCVECTGVNGLLLFGAIVFLFLLVGFLLRSGSESAGHLTILIYFLQISALELQQPVDTSNTSSINWLQVFNLGVLSLNTCFAPLTPIQQILLTYASPIILFLVLLVMGGGHRLFYRFNLCRRWLGRLSLNSYIACTLTILLFCYTSVTVMVVRTLNCVTIAPDVTVLWSQPTVDCLSEEYHQVFIVTTTCLVVYTIGFPLVICVFLFVRHRSTPTPTSASMLTTHSHAARSSLPWSSLAPIRSLDNDLRQPFQLSPDPSTGASNPPSVSNDDPLRPSSPSSQLSDPSDSRMLPSADGRTVLTQFDLRWGALYLEFGAHSWYWSSWILVRRFAFALVSVLITENINLTFILFTVLNMISFCVHLLIHPFRSSILNKVEIGAHLLLMTISFILNGSGASRPLVIQLVVLLLIIPPGLAFGIYTLKHHFIRLKKKKIHSRPNRSPTIHEERSVSIQHA